MSAKGSQIHLITINQNSRAKQKRTWKENDGDSAADNHLLATNRHDNDETDSCSLPKHVFLCLLAIGVTFTMLGLVIALNSKSIEKVVVKEKASTPQDGCSANSFMINDGICDELTNSKRCLFDGGDCCRQEKSTPLCEVCTCKLDTNATQLRMDFESQDVILFSNGFDFPSQELASVAKIEDVDSIEVCSRICMDSATKSLMDDWRILKGPKTTAWRHDINAWLFQANGTCHCLTMLTPFCQSDNTSLVDPGQENLNELGGPTLMFIQRSKTIPCYCFYFDIQLLTNKKAKVSRQNQRSSWHCQKECQAQPGCLYFSTNFNASALEEDTCLLFQLEIEDLTTENVTGWGSGPKICPNETATSTIEASVETTTTTTTVTITIITTNTTTTTTTTTTSTTTEKIMTSTTKDPEQSTIITTLITSTITTTTTITTITTTITTTATTTTKTASKVSTPTKITTTTINRTVEMRFLLVVSGKPCHKDYEIIDLSEDRKDSLVCRLKSNGFDNLGRSGATGAYMDRSNYVVICGGTGGDYCQNALVRSECLLMDSTIGTMMDPIQMANPRRNAASTVMSDGTLWISGGLAFNSMKLDSSEFIDSISGSARPGPDLPMSIQGHCVLALDSSSLMLIGAGINSDETRIWTMETNWTQGPKLIQGRLDATCGVIKDLVFGYHLVAIAGGRDGSDPLKSMESWTTNLLDPPNGNFTESVNSLIHGIVDAASVVLPNKSAMIVAGGQKETGSTDWIFWIQCSNGVLEHDLTKIRELSTERYDSVAMLVPDNLVECAVL